MASRWRVNLRGSIGTVIVCLVSAVPAWGQIVAVSTPDQVNTTDPLPKSDPRSAAILARRVRVDLHDVSIREALDKIAEQAKISLLFNESLVPATQRVTIRAIDISAGEAFRRVLAETNVEVVVRGTGQAALVRQSARSQAATGTVVGRVTDSASGHGLNGATVRVQGLKLAAVTADNGTFTLRDVPTGDQMLAVRLVGYRPATQMVTVTENASITVRIALSTAPTILSGMVTTATGTHQKREVGNDITTLNVDSIRRVAPISSVTDLLESRVPGLTVLRSSGVPGDPARLRLRGAGSITGNNDPILVIDGIRVYAAQSDQRTANLAGSKVVGTGVFSGRPDAANYAAPSPLDQLDPNSIETVEVLKGPSASSLYGADAANGVIVITTKKGRAGPTRWSALFGQGLSYLPGDYPIQILRWGHNTNDGGGAALQSAAGSVICNVANISCNVVDSVTHLQLLNLPRWSPFGHGSTSNASVSASGGVSALTYALTGSVGSNLGYLRLPDALVDAFRQVHGYDAPGWSKRPDKYTTWGGQGQFTAQVMPTMQLILTSQLSHGLQQRSSLEKVLSRLQGAVDTVGGNSDLADIGVRYANAYERATDEQLTFNNAVTVSWAPWTWLPLTGIAGLSTVTGHEMSLLPRDIVPYTDSKDTLGRYGVAQKSATQKTLKLSTMIPGWNGRLRSAVGFEVTSQSTTDLSAHQDTLGFGVNTPATLGGTRSDPTRQTVTGTATYGWFFEPRLLLSDRFFLTPGFRLDGGTANGKQASVGGLPSKLSFASLFPNVNLSYVAVNRQDGDAAPLWGMLTLLRPRIALGSAGVQPTPGDQLRLGRATNISLNGLPANNDSLTLDGLGNTQLRPERSTELEGGFEGELWHGRVTLDVTHSRKMQHDAIISVPVAPSIFGSNQEIRLNIGEVRNTSNEFSVTMRPIETGMVSWSVGGNWSRNDSKVLRLNQRSAALIQGVDGITGNQQTSSFSIQASKIAVGYPLFGRWARPIVGYSDLNGNGKIDVLGYGQCGPGCVGATYSEILLGDTSVYLGRNDPASTAAFTNDLTLFHGRLGVHVNFVYSGAQSLLNGAGQEGTSLSAANEVGATLGQQANYIAAVNGMTTIGLAQTVSSWRFQSFSLNYNMPTSIARRFHSTRMSIDLQGSNLGLWTNYRGKDPNVNAFPNGNVTADNGQVVLPRTWSIQLILGN